MSLSVTELDRAAAARAAREYDARHRSRNPRTALSLSERMADKYTPGQADACWEWRGATSADGTPQLTYRGHHVNPRRVVWEAKHGALKENQIVRSTCTNRLCMNDAHLIAVTRSAAREYKPTARQQPSAIGHWPVDEKYLTGLHLIRCERCDLRTVARTPKAQTLQGWRRLSLKRGTAMCPKCSRVLGVKR